MGSLDRSRPPHRARPGPDRPRLGPGSGGTVGRVSTRALDLGRVASALVGQAEVVAAALLPVPGDRWSAATPLAGWTTLELVAHLSQTLRTVVEMDADARAPISIARYVAALTPAAAEIRDREVAAALGRTPDELRTAYGDLLAAVRERLDRPLTETVVRAPRGPLRTADFLATRVLELVVHADDLARTTGVRVASKRQAVGISCRLLAAILTDRAPGRSVELRVPPFVAVQCVAGPRHTRGTPPNVVEAQPDAFLRLATGRMAWADAIESATVVASGDRSDLSELFPILR